MYCAVRQPILASWSALDVWLDQFVIGRFMEQNRALVADQQVLGVRMVSSCRKIQFPLSTPCTDTNSGMS